MMIVRYMGYALSSCAIILLGFEIVRYLEIRAASLISVQQAWQSYNAASLNQLSVSIAQSRFPGLWEDLFMSLLSVPLLALLVVGSVFLLFISRHGHLER